MSTNRNKYSTTALRSFWLLLLNFSTYFELYKPASSMIHRKLSGENLKEIMRDTSTSTDQVILFVGGYTNGNRSFIQWSLRSDAGASVRYEVRKRKTVVIRVEHKVCCHYSVAVNDIFIFTQRTMSNRLVPSNRFDLMDSISRGIFIHSPVYALQEDLIRHHEEQAHCWSITWVGEEWKRGR
jgi:hypothetical protein